MNLVQWHPFPEFSILQHQVNRLFDEAFRGVSTDSTTAVPAAWSPAADVCETEDHLIIRAELPGVDRKTVDVRLENNVLTIRGERRFEGDPAKENYHRIERSYGAFSRAFTLPVGVDADGIRAEFADGILRITLPKAQAAKPKRIQIASSAA